MPSSGLLLDLNYYAQITVFVLLFNLRFSSFRPVRFPNLFLSSVQVSLFPQSKHQSDFGLNEANALLQYSCVFYWHGTPHSVSWHLQVVLGCLLGLEDFVCRVLAKLVLFLIASHYPIIVY